MITIFLSLYIISRIIADIISPSGEMKWVKKKNLYLYFKVEVTLLTYRRVLRKNLYPDGLMPVHQMTWQTRLVLHLL
jgi:hypothetical protein